MVTLGRDHAWNATVALLWNMPLVREASCPICTLSFKTCFYLLGCFLVPYGST